MILARHLPVDDGRRALRPLSPADSSAYAAGTRDPLVQQFAHLPESRYTPESVARLAREDVPAGLARGDLAVLSIVDPDDHFLGSLVLFDVRPTTAEVGFWLRPEARGAGHGSGALALAADLAGRCGFTSLTARTADGNAASGRTLARAGFDVVGRATGRTPAGVDVTLVHHRLDISPTGSPAVSTDTPDGVAHR